MSVMSEGTMHRPAQRITRILVCAAVVPVALVASGCSLLSGSGSGDKTEGDAKPASSAPAAGVRQAVFSRLPDPCSALSDRTRGELVPEAGSGTHGASGDTSLRGTCSFSSLDNNGVHGSQFRWLNVSLARFASDPSRGDGAKLAAAYYAKQVAVAQATEGAVKLHSEPVAGLGDKATAVSYDLKKKEGAFKQQTVITRTENVVVTIDYDGAGLAGENTPDAGALMKGAQRAAKEAVNAVARANSSGSGAHSTRSPSSHSSSSHDSSDSAASSSRKAKKPITRRTH
jgi:hypothetical protein